MYLLFDSAILLLGMFSKKIIKSILRKWCVWRFIYRESNPSQQNWNQILNMQQ